jgi:hypothetical protein
VFTKKPSHKVSEPSGGMDGVNSHAIHRRSHHLYRGLLEPHFSHSRWEEGPHLSISSMRSPLARLSSSGLRAMKSWTTRRIDPGRAELAPVLAGAMLYPDFCPTALPSRSRSRADEATVSRNLHSAPAGTVGHIEKTLREQTGDTCVNHKCLMTVAMTAADARRRRRM